VFHVEYDLTAFVGITAAEANTQAKETRMGYTEKLAEDARARAMAAVEEKSNLEQRAEAGDAEATRILTSRKTMQQQASKDQASKENWAMQAQAGFRESLDPDFGDIKAALSRSQRTS